MIFISPQDVNNWWIVKRPDRNTLSVENTKEPDSIKHGDIIQLVHGMTSRALNSHDVAAPVSPQNQVIILFSYYKVFICIVHVYAINKTYAQIILGSIMLY